MWLPFNTFELWTERTDKCSIQASLDDRNLRVFEFCFDLYNPITFESNIGIVNEEGSKFLRISNVFDDKNAELSFHSEGDKNLVTKIFIRISANKIDECFNSVISIISKILSWWTFQTSASSAIKKILIRDKNHGAEWETEHISVNANYQVSLPPKFDADEEVNSVLALYREGKNSSSVYYRFLWVTHYYWGEIVILA